MNYEDYLRVNDYTNVFKCHDREYLVFPIRQEVQNKTTNTK